MDIWWINMYRCLRIWFTRSFPESYVLINLIDFHIIVYLNSFDIITFTVCYKQKFCLISVIKNKLCVFICVNAYRIRNSNLNCENVSSGNTAMWLACSSWLVRRNVWKYNLEWHYTICKLNIECMFSICSNSRVA